MVGGWVKLSKPIDNVLKRGLSFSILTLKMDLTHVLVGFKIFEHTAIWYEFWYGKEKSKENKPLIFRRNKRNLPKNQII